MIPLRNISATILVLTFLLTGSTHAADLVTMTGTIIDATGAPVAGADVYLYNSDNVRRPGDYISNRTLADGKYQVVVMPGTYWAVARFRSDGAQFGPLSAKDKHSGEPQKVEIKSRKQISMDFTVRNLQEAAKAEEKKREDYYKITGRIVDESNKGVPMAYAMASPTLKTTVQIPEYLSVWTDTTGSFTLYLPTGTFRLGASQNMPPDTKCPLNRELSVTKDQESVVIRNICGKP